MRFSSADRRYQTSEPRETGSGDTVRLTGSLVSGLTPADIGRLKFYEASDYEGSDYTLTTLPVECRGELLPAEVFLPNIEADETAWSFDTWNPAERPLFMAMVEERMSRYGSITAAENNALWPQMKSEVERRFRRR